jgi:hypothetical protein
VQKCWLSTDLKVASIYTHPMESSCHVIVFVTSKSFLRSSLASAHPLCRLQLFRVKLQRPCFTYTPCPLWMVAGVLCYVGARQVCSLQSLVLIYIKH